MRIIDISLPVYDGMPVYPGTAGTMIKEVKSGSGQSVLSQLSLTSHAGTHIDAPYHAVEKGKQLKDLDLELFYGPCRVLDMTVVRQGVTRADLAAKNIEHGERILLKTTNSQRGFKQFHEDYIYLTAQAAEYLAELGIELVGIDSLSVKKRGDKDNTSHTALLQSNIPIIEGLDLSSVSEGEYILAAFPLALQTDGAPSRVVLMVDEKAFVQPEQEAAKLYTDGGSRGNPGPAATAFVICKVNDNVVEKSGRYIGHTTNNQAEYQALIAGLKRARELGIQKLYVYMDSELLVKQLNGLYKIKNAELLPHYRAAKEIAGDFDTIEFTHIPRALNKQADAEVNRILDEQQK